MTLTPYKGVCMHCGHNHDIPLIDPMASSMDKLLLESKDKRIAELELQHLEDLVEAYELIAEWGAYASPYFQEKYDWKGDMNRFLSKADAIRKEIEK